MPTDTERLDFLINTNGNLNDNQGYGYMFWYRRDDGYPIGHTRIIKDRSARDAIDAAMINEQGGG